MTAITMTSPRAAVDAESVTKPLAEAVAPAPLTTAVRFLGHFASALVGVALLGGDLEH